MATSTPSPTVSAPIPEALPGALPPSDAIPEITLPDEEPRNLPPGQSPSGSPLTSPSQSTAPGPASTWPLGSTRHSAGDSGVSLQPLQPREPTSILRTTMTNASSSRQTATNAGVCRQTTTHAAVSGVAPANATASPKGVSWEKRTTVNRHRVENNHSSADALGFEDLLDERLHSLHVWAEELRSSLLTKHRCHETTLRTQHQHEGSESPRPVPFVMGLQPSDRQVEITSARNSVEPASPKGRGVSFDTETVRDEVVDYNNGNDEEAMMTTFSSANPNRFRSVDSDEKLLFLLLDTWKAAPGPNNKSRATFKQQKTMTIRASHTSHSSGKQEDDDDDEEAKMWQRIHQRLIVHPCSPKRVLWSLTILALVVFDGITLPLSVFERNPFPGFSMVSRILWCLDIPCSLISGFHDKLGSIVVERKKVFQHYVRTWFFLDVLLATLDWTQFALQDTLVDKGAGSWLLSSASPLLFLRVLLRLLRLWRDRDISEFIVEKTPSDSVILIGSIFKYIAAMICFTHLVACSWYKTGVHDWDESKTWVKEYGIEDSTFGTRYLFSLHQAFALYAGSDLIVPANIPERCYVVVALFMSCLVSVWVVSSITTFMTRLQIIAGKRHAEFLALGRYLSDNSISRELTAKVKRNAQYAHAEMSRNAPEETVELLKLVSDPLRALLHFELYSDHVFSHPFFMNFYDINPIAMKTLCHKGLTRLNFFPSDVIFQEHDISSVMYFVVKGSMRYTNSSPRPVKIYAGDWLSEPCLWTTWTHRGSVGATSDTVVLALESLRFRNIMRNQPDPEIRRYAAHFVNMLQQMEEEELSDCCVMGEDSLFDKVLAKVFPVEDEDVGRFSVSGMIIGRNSRVSRASRASRRSTLVSFMRAGSGNPRRSARNTTSVVPVEEIDEEDEEEEEEEEEEEVI